MTDFDINNLPEFRSWRARFQPPPDERAFLSEHLSVTTALLFSEILVPDFTLVRGCVIVRSHFSPANFEQWWSSQSGESTSIERAINRIHLWDIFEPAGDQDERALEALAERIATSWTLHAQRQFTDREFHTQVSDDYGPTITISSRLRAP